ncbi:Rop family plasmid primer RNA-binding protein, partial [Enterobacter hormaechei]
RMTPSSIHEKIITRRRKSPVTRQQSAAHHNAKYIRPQTLLLLERLEHMDLDEAAGCCEHLPDQAERVYAMLNPQIGEENA